VTGGYCGKEGGHDGSDGETAVREWVKQAERDQGTGHGGLTSDERGELAELRRENRRLKEDVDILKQATAFFAKETGGNVYPFIEAEKARRRNVKRGCELLEVSRSAYYAPRGGSRWDRYMISQSGIREGETVAPNDRSSPAAASYATTSPRRSPRPAPPPPAARRRRGTGQISPADDVTGITQQNPDLTGARWGATVGRHGATPGLAERSEHAPELASSHDEPYRPTAESSFASRGSVCIAMLLAPCRRTVASFSGHLRHCLSVYGCSRPLRA
jgi:transposase-like protein